MAHNINFNEQTGKHSFFSVKEKAWHQLGQIVQDYPTSAEALQFAGIDFSVVKAPNIHRLPEGNEVIPCCVYWTASRVKERDKTILHRSVDERFGKLCPHPKNNHQVWTKGLG